MEAHGLIGQDDDAGCFGVVVLCHAISRALNLLHPYVNFHRLQPCSFTRDESIPLGNRCIDLLDV